MTDRHFLMMPSRFEPCGLNQIYSQCYGTPLLVHTTGGLTDMVEDGITGLIFSPMTAEAFLASIRRALAATMIRKSGKESSAMAWNGIPVGRKVPLITWRFINQCWAGDNPPATLDALPLPPRLMKRLLHRRQQVFHHRAPSLVDFRDHLHAR